MVQFHTITNVGLVEFTGFNPLKVFQTMVKNYVSKKVIDWNHFKQDIEWVLMLVAVRGTNFTKSKAKMDEVGVRTMEGVISRLGIKLVPASQLKSGDPTLSRVAALFPQPLLRGYHDKPAVTRIIGVHSWVLRALACPQLPSILPAKGQITSQLL